MPDLVGFYRLVVYFVLHGCDTRHSSVSFEEDRVGERSGCLSTVQSSWAAKCAIRSYRWRDGEMRPRSSRKWSQYCIQRHGARSNMAAYHFGGICVSRWVVERESRFRGPNQASSLPQQQKSTVLSCRGSAEHLPSILYSSCATRHAVYVQETIYRERLISHTRILQLVTSFMRENLTLSLRRSSKSSMFAMWCNCELVLGRAHPTLTSILMGTKLSLALAIVGNHDYLNVSQINNKVLTPPTCASQSPNHFQMSCCRPVFQGL